MRPKTIVGAACVAVVALVGGAHPGAALSTAQAKKDARSVLVTIKDLPTGWTSKAPTASTPQDKEDSRALAACTGASDPSRNLADVKGNSFDLGNAGISSSAEVTRSEADYKKDVAALLGSKAETCLRTSFAKQLQGSGLAVKSVTFERFKVARHGTLSTGIRMVFTVESQGQTIGVYFDGIALGKSPVEVSLTLTNVGAPFDPALEKQLVAAVGKRIDKL